MSVTDIVFLTDLSGSFGDDLPQWQSKVPAVVTRLINPNLASVFGNDVNFGIASFIDKPVSPFGASSDYVYQQELGLTTDITAVQTTVNSLTIGSGADGPEAQLEALMHTALDSSLGYRTGSSRIVVLATDAPYHQAGDGLVASSITNPNDRDNIVEADEDYPNISQVKTAIENNGIFPVFLVSGGDSVKSSYDTLVSQLGTGAVISLDSDSENIADALKFAVALANDVTTIDTGLGEPIGDGDDTIFPFGLSGDQVVFAGGGNDSVFLTSTPGNHYIDGGAGFDVLYGGVGQDTIDGGSSDDNLVGGAGPDTLFGSSGNDTLAGGAGNDYLQGDSGDDILTGGDGADRFGFATGTVFDMDDLGVDVITDFDAIEGDKIQLSKSTFGALSSPVGPLNASDFGTVITYNNTTGFLSYQGEHFATFTSAPTLNTNNFDVVDF